MLNRLPAIVFVLMLLVVSACRNPPDYPDEPVIGYIGASETTMTQSQVATDDFIRFTISFTDGDGDLGISSDFSDTTKVYYVDTRISDVKSVSIPMIPELGTANGVSGEITFKVPTTCCFYPPGYPQCQPVEEFPTNTVVYDIYIIDRKQNKSNVIQSEPITLLCD